MTILLSIILLMQAPSATAPAEYIVGPQDRLAITVFDEPTLTKTVTVDSDGTFDFPLVGRIAAGGLSVRQITADLKKRLGPPNGFLVNPQVSIEVDTYRSQVVYVNGQVRVPGAVPLKGAMTIMKMAGLVVDRSAPAQAAGTRRKERWGFPELFVVSQTLIPALLYLPGTQPFRLYIRVASFAISFGTLLWWAVAVAKTSRPHRAQPWIFAAMAYLVIMDVQGAEFHALRGARNTIRRAGERLTIVAEMHPQCWPSFGIRLDDAQETIASLGLTAEPLEPGTDLFGRDGHIVLRRAAA